MRLFLAGLVLFLGACASVPRASLEDQTKAKGFQEDPNTANVYIYRNEFMGTGMKMKLVVDGKRLGETTGKTFILAKLPPGKHTLVSEAENDSELTFVCEKNKNYFIWQEVRMGLLTARSRLSQVDETTGKKGVQECELVISE